MGPHHFGNGADVGTVNKVKRAGFQQRLIRLFVVTCCNNVFLAQSLSQDGDQFRTDLANCSGYHDFFHFSSC